MGRDRGGPEGFRLVRPTRTAAVVAGPAVGPLWWLHGHTVPDDAVTLDGDRGAIRALRSALMHPVEEKQDRRCRWWGEVDAV